MPRRRLSGKIKISLQEYIRSSSFSLLFLPGFVIPSRQHIILQQCWLKRDFEQIVRRSARQRDESASLQNEVLGVQVTVRLCRSRPDLYLLLLPNNNGKAWCKWPSAPDQLFSSLVRSLAAFFSYYSPAPPTNYNSKMRDLSASAAFPSGRCLRFYVSWEQQLCGRSIPIYPYIPRRRCWASRKFEFTRVLTCLLLVAWLRTKVAAVNGDERRGCKYSSAFIMLLL